MDDLGEVNEVPADLYEFINVRSQLCLGTGSPPTRHHRSLLVSSSQHGILYAAVGCTLRICPLVDLRDPPNSSSSTGVNRISNTSVVTVDLASQDVSSILHILLFLSDTILIVLATRATDSSQNKLLFLHVTALSNGRILEMRSPQIEGVTNVVVSAGRTNEKFSLFALSSNSNVHVYRATESDSQACAEIPVSGALSIALSDDESLMAIGTTRGNVMLFNPLEGTKAGSVVEVESGWQPFQVYFAGMLDLFVSYQHERNTNHVMWHLARVNNGLSVKSHSPFGELCYAIYSNDDGEDAAMPPYIMFSYISDWDLAVVTSTKSSDIEVIARLEDGGSWANYKLGDKREAILPIVDGDDTLPIGAAFDLNDTSSIPARDPDDPDINPMPTLIILTSKYALLSYRLVDDHRGAQCRGVRSPNPLPSLPPSTTVKRPSSSEPVLEGDSSDLVRSYSGGMQFDETSERKPTFTDEFNDGTPSVRYNTSSNDSSPSKSNSTASESSSSSNNQRTSTSADHTLRTPDFPREPFSHISTSLHDALEIDENRSSASAPEEAHNDPVAPGLQSVLPVQTLPTVHLEPNLNEALDAITSDPNDPLSIIRSMIHEMNAELEVTRKASRAMWEDLDALKMPINSSIDEIRKECDAKSSDLHKSFETEKQLRIGVQDSMQNVLKLYREYETISLEGDVHHKNTSSFQLPEEYKKSEEKMACREVEIEKSIRYIDEKLNSATIKGKDHMEPSEKVQMIYSSISLQGLRIRRVLALLESLSERVGTEDRISRRSELGLSLARLEKLTLESNLKTDVCIESNAEKLRQEIPKTEGDGNVRDQNKFARSGTSLLPAEICQILRRLAMRGGRESISVDSPVESPSTLSASKRSKERSFIKRADAINALHSIVRESSQIPKELNKSKDTSEPKSKQAPIHTPPSIPKPPLMGGKRAEPSVKFPTKPPSSELAKKPILRTKPQESPFALFGNSTVSSSTTSSKAKSFDKKEGWNNMSFAQTNLKETNVSKSQNKEAPTDSKMKTFESLNQRNPTNFSLSAVPPTVESSPTADDGSLPTIDLTAPSWAKPPGWASIQANISRATVFPLQKKTTSVFERSTNEDSSSETTPESSRKPNEIGVDVQTKGTDGKSALKTEVSESTEVQFASLPPDEDTSRASRSAASDLESERKKKSSSASPFVAVTQDTSPQREIGKSGLFAHLPPDDDEDGGLKSTSANVSAAPSFSLHTQKPPSVSEHAIKHGESFDERKHIDAEKSETTPPIGMFGSQLNFGGESKSSQSNTGEPNSSASTMSAGGTTSTFGMSSSFSSGNAFGFGSSENLAFNFSFNSSSGGGLFGGGFGSASFGSIKTEDTSLFSAAASKQDDMAFKATVADPNPIDGGSTDDSEEETHQPLQQERMDTPSTPVQSSGAFGGNGSQHPFGFGMQSTNAPLFASSGSSGSFFSRGDLGGGPNSFGNTMQSANGFGSGMPDSGMLSGQSGTVSAFGQSSVLGQSGSFGQTPFGSTSSFGFSSMGGFGGMSAKFGESSFGSSSASLFGTPNSGPSMFGSGASASPFGSIGGGGASFGGTPGSASGFASIAGSGPLPVFGNGQPPAFTSPAFSERRA